MQGKAREMETDENRTDDGLLTLSSYILWHGTPIECDVLSQYETELKTHKLELFAHSHPGEPIPEASLNDRKFLRYIGQKKSRVISGMTGVSIEFEDTF